MKRRTLDITFATGGAVIAVMMLVLGFVLADQYNWGKNYVKEELSSQKITFATTDALAKDAETNKANPDPALRDVRSWKPGSACLTKYAGQLMTTGKQAECYAKYYIGMHLDRSAAAATADGKSLAGATYATLGETRTDLSAKIAAAKAATPPETERAAALQKELDAATSLRTTMQTGETLRGLLLTSYGFSVMGDKAQVISTIAYIVAGLLAILSIAGFVHAWLAKDAKVFESKTTPVAPARPATVN
jgi:hypothetical protein